MEEQHPQQIMHLGEGTPMQEHVQPMDQDGHSIANQQFDFATNQHVLQSHVTNSPHVLYVP
jgi:hypothetical protein